ncbi:hypothetical protein HQ590_05615, partial [bacterium]|nr:hypothetical protein [bacterium]
PSYYSYHAAGLPSSVHVFALTMETPAVLLQVKPDNYGHIWTAPEKPSYTLTLRNPTAAARSVQIDLRTTSYNGTEQTAQTKTVRVPAGGKETVLKLPLALKQYGYHDLSVTLTDGDQVWVEPLSLAFLAPDTRERGQWEPGRGTLFGFWCWRGGHGTPSFEKETLVTALAGAETYGGSYQTAPDPVKKLAEKYGMMSQKYFGAGDHWITGALVTDLTKTSEAAAVEKFVAALEKTITRPSPVTKPRYLSFFPEPHIGHHTSGSFPHLFGEPPAELSTDEEQRYQRYLKALLVGGPVVRQRWPDCLILMPHGDPMFTALFARRSPEARPFIDGIAVDIPLFERLPEQQTHQVTLHRFWQCWQELRQAGITNLALPMYEGPCLPSRPGALTEEEFANHLARSVLILNAYGVDQFPGAWGAFECSAAWGEQHYGGGVMHRLPLERPKPAYAAHATLSRHLNRENFKKWLPTGSLSVYALQYQHYQNGDLTHVLWTIRGTRPVSVTVPPGTKATLYDLMDNATELQEQNGQLRFTIGSGPCFLKGLTNDVPISLGEPDHADAQPAPDALRLGNPGDRGWRQLDAADPDYAESNYDQIRRFPGRMTLQTADAPEPAGRTALAVHLEKQDQERLIMPYYTSVVPHRPITIPGKASHLGLWVRAASDWGRVVYCLRDAQGERWISVGTKGAWNADDTHNWSVFNFDGWRYLRFELPAHSPWDTFREAGTTWWGAYGAGDQIVDLPLRLEKIIIERRTHAMYVNDPQPTAGVDVLLGDLYAEYQRPADRSTEIVRLSRQRMPVPRGVPELGNPIAELEQGGVGAATTGTRIALPEQQADGTRCYVHFPPVAGAKVYDVWASPYPDGQGALQLAKGWKEPGGLVRGLRPDTDFYLFVVYTDQDGKLSKPSAAFKIRLKDLFAMK